jgi:hypothetical protein
MSLASQDGDLVEDSPAVRGGPRAGGTDRAVTVADYPAHLLPERRPIRSAAPRRRQPMAATFLVFIFPPSAPSGAIGCVLYSTQVERARPRKHNWMPAYDTRPEPLRRAVDDTTLVGQVESLAEARNTSYA